MVFLFVALTFFPLTTLGNDQEITYLLEFIEQSGCQFDRNGSVHDPAEARSHIEMKYDYAKKWISTTEDFIEYTATKSSMSGKLYHVVCNGERIPSGEWLLQALAEYRKAPGVAHN
jgi:hypothetical protein